MPGEDKQTGTCELCGNTPRVCRRLESGQWVCHMCLRSFKPEPGPREPKGPRPATDKQRALAASLRVDLPDGCTTALASRLITCRKRCLDPRFAHQLESHEFEQLVQRHDAVRYYVMDLWQDLTGKRPKEVGIPWEDQQLFAAEIVTRHPTTADICGWESEVAYEEYPRSALPHSETRSFIRRQIEPRWRKYRRGGGSLLDWLLG